jgi:DMSO/TMAO reductase YedYZ molybdopterin-dependent catalytic subunit
MTTQSRQGPAAADLRMPGRLTGAACGIAAAAAATGVSQLIAGLTTPQASPVIDVEQVIIGGTPPAISHWAITTFGTNDKAVLLGGVLVALAVFAGVIGVAAVRRLAYGMAGLAVFGVLGLGAVLTRPDSAGAWIWPSLIGTAGGAIALATLVKVACEATVAAPPAQRAGPPGRANAGKGNAGKNAKAGPGRQAAAGKGAGSRPAAQAGQDAKAAPGTALEAASAVTAQTPSTASQTTAKKAPAKPAGGRGPAPVAMTPGGRRKFLATAGTSVAIAAVGEYGGRQLSTRQNVTQAQAAIRFPRPAVKAPPLPAGIDPKAPGLSPFVTPNSKFYRVDTALVLPQVDPKGWSLRIHGMVQRELTVTFDDLLRRPLIEDWLTLLCVSNPVGGPYIGNAKWLGPSLAALIRQARPLAGADQLLCTSVEGFTEGTPLACVLDNHRQSLVAIGMNGAPLPVAHGFPARTVVPGLYGYVSACKWIADIKVTTFAQDFGYWVQNGWSQQAPIKTESRIDVPGNGATVGPGPVTVAGVAWAQHKGVDAVEVQVDNGPWQQATLAAVPGIDTWRQWTWDWKSPAPGNHVIQARATDATGYTQTSALADVAPNGATGYPSVQVAVRQA